MPIGLGWDMPDDVPSLLQVALLRRTAFTVSELADALTSFNLIPEGVGLDTLSQTARLELLVNGAGFADPAPVIEAYKKPAPPPPEFQPDPELDGLLEELAEDLADNAADLKAYRGQLKNKAAKSLGEARRRARADKQRRLRSFRKKRAEKKASKGKLKLKPVRVLKKRPLPDPLAPPPAAQPRPDRDAAKPAAGTEPAQPPPEPMRLAPDVAIRAPRGGGGWQVVEVPPHGWIRFHPEKGNVDAHCRYHQNCKLHRRSHNGVLGIIGAWLNRGPDCVDKPTHFQDRIVLSLDVTFGEREAVRDTMSASDDVQMQLLADTERAHRHGDFSEPESILLQVPQHVKMEALALHYEKFPATP